MYMICHLSYTLQGHALFFRQIFLLMPQVNLVDSRVCVQTSSADTRYFSFDTLWSCRYSASNVCMNSDLTGNNDHVEALRVYLLSRSLSRLKNQFQAGNGMVSSHSSQPRCIFHPGPICIPQFLYVFFCLSVQITVDCIEGYPAINLQLGKHVFLSAGDFYLASGS